MNNAPKTFLGYLIIGAVNRQEAEKQKGLILWTPSKPGFFKRFMLRNLLGIYWVDRVRQKGDKAPMYNNEDVETQLPAREIYKAPIASKECFKPKPLKAEWQH